MAKQYLAAGIGSHEKYSRIFSGFEVKQFQQPFNASGLRSELGLRPDDLVIGKIARLTTLKGHDELIAIAPRLIAEISNARFLLVGDGRLRSQLEAKVRALGLEKHFVFTGLVSPAEIPPFIATMDILVHLSRREGLARALPQALASGCPVVAYDCDGASEICLPDQSGVLVPPGDREKLLASLLLLARQPELRKRYGEHGRQFVKENFESQKMVDDLQSLYLRLVPEKKA